MQKRSIFLLLLVMMLTALATAPHAMQAQDSAPFSDPLLAQTSGILGPDNTVFYSIFLASGPDDLQTLSISSPLPADTTFVDVFWTPDSAEFAGASDGLATWTLDELAANTIIGPFTVQVAYADAEFEAPASIPARITWDGGSIDAYTFEGILTPYDALGSITVDENGTGETLIPVENTGVLIQIPAGAFDQAVTFTFERLSLEDTTDLPPSDQDIWWCYRFNMTIRPEGLTPALPITVVYPTRRALTPGLPVFTFHKPLEGDWTLLESLALNQPNKASRQSPQTHLNASALVALNGNQIIAILIGTRPIPDGIFQGGVPTPSRRAAIVDGTSNTLRPYIEQDNIGWPRYIEQD